MLNFLSITPSAPLCHFVLKNKRHNGREGVRRLAVSGLDALEWHQTGSKASPIPYPCRSWWSQSRHAETSIANAQFDKLALKARLSHTGTPASISRLWIPPDRVPRGGAPLVLPRPRPSEQENCGGLGIGGWASSSPRPASFSHPALFNSDTFGSAGTFLLKGPEVLCQDKQMIKL